MTLPRIWPAQGWEDQLGRCTEARGFHWPYSWVRFSLTPGLIVYVCVCVWDSGQDVPRTAVTDVRIQGSVQYLSPPIAASGNDAARFLTLPPFLGASTQLSPPLLAVVSGRKLVRSTNNMAGILHDLAREAFTPAVRGVSNL